MFTAKAGNSTKTLAKVGWSVCSQRHVCSSPSRLQSCMSAWVINQYGTNEVLKYSEEIPVPNVRSPSDVLIKVHAASLNPIDVSMRGKSWQTQFEYNSTKGLQLRFLTHLLALSFFRRLWS